MLNCYVICYNNGWLVRNTVGTLKRFSDEVKCIVVDNCSNGERTKQTLADLEAEGVTVLRMSANRGHRVVFDHVRPQETMYIVTDPDLDLTKLPQDTIEQLKHVSEQLQAHKVGLALDISSADDLLEGEYVRKHANLVYNIGQWEAQFWKHRVEQVSDVEVYDAPIDTTFALYNKLNEPQDKMTRMYRLAGPYTVRHLMWHKSWVKQLNEEDYKDYFLSAQTFVSTTSKLVRAYFDELQRKRLQDQDQH